MDDSDDCIESDIVFKWTNCCRLCLTTHVDIDIFDPESTHHDVIAKISESLNVLVYRGDPMPRKLCSTCWNHLESWQLFRSKCAETKANIKKRLGVYRMLEFVAEFLKRDEAFRVQASTAPEATAQGAKAEKERNSAAISNPGQESQTAWQEPADSTNSNFVGVPIKLEPMDVSMTDDNNAASLNNTAENSQLIGNPQVNVVPRVEQPLRYFDSVHNGSRDSEKQVNALLSGSNPVVNCDNAHSEDIDSSRQESALAISGSNPVAYTESSDTDRQGSALAILRQMANVMEQRSETPEQLDPPQVLHNNTSNENTLKVRQNLGYGPDFNQAKIGDRDSLQVNPPVPRIPTMLEQHLLKSATLPSEQDPAHWRADVNPARITAVKESTNTEQHRNSTPLASEHAPAHWRADVNPARITAVKESTNTEQHRNSTPLASEHAPAHWRADVNPARITAVKESTNTEQHRNSTPLASEHESAHWRGDLNPARVTAVRESTNTEQHLNSTPLSSEQESAHWRADVNPARITAVKGSANTLWASQPNEDPHWTDQDMLEVKDEPMSPPNLTRAEPVCENSTDSRFNTDPAVNEPMYNLRPRVVRPLNYGEVEDWLEEVDTPPPRPSRLKVTPWKCGACQLYFASSRDILSHQASHECLGNQMECFPCEICWKKFFDKNDLAEHNLVHLKVAYNLTVDDLRRCNKCDLSFADPRRWKKHGLMHALKRMPSQATQYPCTECGVVFIRKASYEAHRRSHEPMAAYSPAPAIAAVSAPAVVVPDRDLACSLCIARFKSEDLLYDHRFATHGIPDERVACVVCSCKFRGPSALQEHMRTHQTRAVARKTTSALRPPAIVIKQEPASLANGTVRCRRCGHVFATREQLAKHEALKHKNASPYGCRKCRRRFPTRSLLLLHQRTHLRPAPVLQDNTVAVKVEPSSQLILTGGADQQSDLWCRDCGIQFKSESDLSQHKVSHLKFGKRPLFLRYMAHHVYRYQCSGCPQLFSSKESLPRHLMNRHPGEPVYHFLPLKYNLTRISVRGESALINARGESALINARGESALINARGESALMHASEESSLNCKACHYQAPTQASLNFHVKIKHKRQDPSADIKSQVEQTPAVNLEASPNPDLVGEVCPYCAGTFAASYIRRHILIQHGTKSKVESCYKTRKYFKCKFCSKRCNTRFNREKHEKTHDPEKYPSWICSCGKVFIHKQKWNYQKHRVMCERRLVVKPQRIATTAIPESKAAPPMPGPAVAPPMPGPAAGQSSDTTPKQYSCSVCFNSYETDNLRELHVMTAHGLAGFSQGQRLSEAARPSPPQERELWREESNKIVREVGGSHRCTLCRVHFDSVQDAAWHRAQHPRGNLYVVQIDDSVFQCTVCDDLFDSRQNALAHATHHAEEDVKPNLEQLNSQLFNCPFCYLKFTSEGSIRSHIFNIHPGGSASTA